MRTGVRWNDLSKVESYWTKNRERKWGQILWLKKNMEKEDRNDNVKILWPIVGGQFDWFCFWLKKILVLQMLCLVPENNLVIWTKNGCQPQKLSTVIQQQKEIIFHTQDKISLSQVFWFHYYCNFACPYVKLMIIQFLAHFLFVSIDSFFNCRNWLGFSWCTFSF